MTSPKNAASSACASATHVLGFRAVAREERGATNLVTPTALPQRPRGRQAGCPSSPGGQGGEEHSDGVTATDPLLPLPVRTKVSLAKQAERTPRDRHEGPCDSEGFLRHLGAQGGFKDHSLRGADLTACPGWLILL